MQATKNNVPDEQLVSQRLAGVLPRIDIAGDPFIVDWRLKELRSTENPGNRIDLRTLPMDGENQHYICFYNTSLKQTVIPDIHMTELPKDVVAVFIPNELKLDPVAVARERGLVETALLKEYPIDPALKAKVVPLEQTEMAALAERNKTKQKLMRQIRPAQSIKKNKGKRI